jgi:putative membrane protein
MKHLKFAVPALAIAVALMTSPAQARTRHKANREAAPSDNTFAMKAAHGGIAEVQMAELAKSKAQSQAVKDLANRLYTDHRNANDQLKTIASQTNMTLPASMDAKDQAEYNKLQNLSGADFDREYVNYEIKDHKEDISMFQQEVDHGTDSQIKSWASQNLPTLREHLRMAESAHSQSAK